MSETKHTPGPWDYSAKLSASENHRGFRIWEHGDSWVLADVMPMDEDGKQGEANARLIAAAPELLEALQECKQLLDMVLCVSGGLPPEANGPAAKALAAVRKATGQ
jgi:hypothetical protein